MKKTSLVVLLLAMLLRMLLLRQIGRRLSPYCVVRRARQPQGRPDERRGTAVVGAEQPNHPLPRPELDVGRELEAQAVPSPAEVVLACDRKFRADVARMVIVENTCSLRLTSTGLVSTQFQMLPVTAEFLPVVNIQLHRNRNGTDMRPQ